MRITALLHCRNFCNQAVGLFSAVFAAVVIADFTINCFAHYLPQESGEKQVACCISE